MDCRDPISLLLCSFLVVFLLYAGPCSAANAGINGPPLSNLTLDMGFNNATHIVSLQVITPFVVYDGNKTGNDRFSGFTVDFLKALSKQVKSNLEFELGDDDLPESGDLAMSKVYGAVGSIKQAHFAAGALHITVKRTSEYTFTQPFYVQGYSLVTQAPREDFDPLTFLKPFSNMLWVAIIVEVFLVAALFWICESPALGAQDSDLSDGAFPSLADAFYLSVSTLTCTLDKAPHSWGGKIVMIGHGWFMLVIISSYTANLASFLTLQTSSPTISSWADITSSNGRYSICVPEGQTQEQFLEFETAQYGYTFSTITRPSWEGCMKAVMDKEANATFQDEPVVQYYLRNTLPSAECLLAEVGNRFNPMGYGLAFGKDSPDFLLYTQGIIILQEKGEIQKLARSYSIGVNAPPLPPCSASQAEDMSFYVNEMYGLMSMTGVIIGLGIAAHLTIKLIKHTGFFPRVTSDDGPPAEGPAPSKLQLDDVGVYEPVREARVSYSYRAGRDAEFEDMVRAGVEHALRLHRRKEGRVGGADYTPDGGRGGFSGIVVQAGSTISAGDDETLMA